LGCSEVLLNDVGPLLGWDGLFGSEANDPISKH